MKMHQVGHYRVQFQAPMAHGPVQINGGHKHGRLQNDHSDKEHPQKTHYFSRRLVGDRHTPRNSRIHKLARHN
jgi:hypothetical protein